MKFDALVIGDTLMEGDFKAGTIMSKAAHPERQNIGYILLMDDRGGFTIYGCRRDTDCSPYLTRSIPGAAFRAMVRQAIDGGPLPDIRTVEPKPTPIDRRFPVLVENPQSEPKKAAEFVEPAIEAAETVAAEPTQNTEGPWIDFV